MDPLDPPSLPFADKAGSSTSSLNQDHRSSSAGSLSANFLPSKFSPAMLEPPGPRRRKGKKGAQPRAPKVGGGIEAFRAGESRMPGVNDEGYDGMDFGNNWLGAGVRGDGKPRKLRWTRFKWVLFVANLLLTAYCLAFLCLSLLVWFNAFEHSDILLTANSTELILSTTAAALGMVAAVVGWAGILLNNRMFLAIYTFMLWVVLAFIAAPGYLTYKRRTFNLEGKINAEWSTALGSRGRLRIQNQLQCCGYFSPFVEATVTQTCYSRSPLDGCKGPYLRFQRTILKKWYLVAFTIVPVHIGVIIAGLLCSNHVTYRFGKGMMPKAYRLNLNSMALFMEQYANQVAEKYGANAGAEIMARSRTNLAQIDSIGSRASIPSSLSSNLPPTNGQPTPADVY